MLHVRSVSNGLQEKAKRQLNEVPSRIRDDISHIRIWLNQQPHIRARTDDQWILNFLRGCKFSLEGTKEKLDMFYTMRSILPTYFADRDPLSPNVQLVLNTGFMLPLPKVVEDSGPRIILIRCCSLNKTIPFQAIIKTLTMINDIMLCEDDNFIIGGQHLFIDLTGTSLEYLLTLNLNELKKIEIFLEKGYPSRPQAFDVINSPPYFETLLNLVRSLMSNKIKERFHVYSACNSEEIRKIIPLPYLPKEYGGECSSIPELTTYWQKKVESYRNWFFEEDQYVVDEGKRLGKPKTSDEMFGIQGSFRKLDID